MKNGLKEYLERFDKHYPVLPLSNQPKRGNHEDLIEMIVPPEPDELTKMRLEQDVEFVKSCCGVKEDLL